MTLSAILLVGGLSRRMGVDKATLLISGDPLWKRQLGCISNLRPEAVWVSARTAPSWRPAEIEVVTDKRPSCGPLSGIAAGLRRLRTSHLLVLAIDLPQMTPEHLRKLCVLAHPGTGVIPFQSDYFEPLCAIYPAEALVATEAALNSGDVSLQHFAQNLLRESQARVYELASEERPLYLNTRHPDRFARTDGELRAGGRSQLGFSDGRFLPKAWCMELPFVRPRLDRLRADENYGQQEGREARKNTGAGSVPERPALGVGRNQIRNVN